MTRTVKIHDSQTDKSWQDKAKNPLDRDLYRSQEAQKLEVNHRDTWLVSRDKTIFNHQDNQR